MSKEIPNNQLNTSNHYTNKFQNRLKSINNATSSETIQTLLNWILFNRHNHSKSFMLLLYDSLLDSNTEISKKVTLFQLLNDIMIYHIQENDTKCKRATTYRDVIKSNDYIEKLLKVVRIFKNDESDVYEKIKEIIEQWMSYDLMVDVDISLYMKLKKLLDRDDDDDSVDGAVESHEIHDGMDVVEEKEESKELALEVEKDDNVVVDDKQEIVSGKEETGNETNPDEVVENPSSENMNIDINEAITEEPLTSIDPIMSATAATSTTDDKIVEETIDDTLEKMDDKTTTINEGGQSNEQEESINNEITNQHNQELIKEAQIDFAKMQNVPYRAIPPSTFYESCKSITQYQIPREIQMESANKYSHLLSTIPQNIIEYALTKLSSSPLDMLNKSVIPDLSVLSDNEVLDMSLKDSMQEVQTLKKTIEIQYNDRMELLQNLYTCQCKFDAENIAKEYYNVREMLESLKKKKEVLEDAMELEGVDVDEIKNKNGGSDGDGAWKDLKDFDWFEKGDVSKNEVVHYEIDDDMAL